MRHAQQLLRIPAALLLGALFIVTGCTEYGPTDARPDGSTDRGPALSASSEQAGFDGDIRIGVVPSTESLTIGADGDFVIRDRETGDELLAGSGGDVQVTLDADAPPQSNFRLQVTCAFSEEARDDLVGRARERNVATYTERVDPPGCWRVYLGEFAPDAGFGERNTFRNEMIDAGLSGTDSFWSVVTVGDDEAQIRLTRGNEEIFSLNPIVLESSSETVRIGDRVYRGVAEVGFNSSGVLAGINEVPLEEYLRGVVPRELGPVAFPEVEALKAQAVTARTFALANIGRRGADGYDLLPTTSDQVYGGFMDEHPVSDQAIVDTEGVVVIYEGRLISTLYSSTSGGHTANNEDVFQSPTPVPYLRGVPVSQRGNSVGNANPRSFRNHANPKSLRAARQSDFESDWSSFHRWHFEWTAEEISDVIGVFAGRDVGAVLEINVLERSSSGRAFTIEFVTENGTFTEQKDRIRWALQYVDAGGNHRPLLSTLFHIEPVTDRGGPNGEVAGFQAWGGGWGHGVGMSQTGAVGMAERGATFDEILKHFYQGTELERRG